MTPENTLAHGVIEKPKTTSCLVLLGVSPPETHYGTGSPILYRLCCGLERQPCSWPNAHTHTHTHTNHPSSEAAEAEECPGHQHRAATFLPNRRESCRDRDGNAMRTLAALPPARHSACHNPTAPFVVKKTQIASSLMSERPVKPQNQERHTQRDGQASPRLLGPVESAQNVRGRSPHFASAPLSNFWLGPVQGLLGAEKLQGVSVVILTFSPLSIDN